MQAALDQVTTIELAAMSLYALLANLTLPLILAQSGAAKTAVGWVIVMLLLLLALLVVARPSGRKIPDGGKKR